MRKISVTLSILLLATSVCSIARAQAPSNGTTADESLLQRQEIVISTYEPPAPLPLPESLFNLKRDKVTVSNKFSCPTESGSIITVPVFAGKKTNIIGPLGDQVSFTPQAHAPDQIFRTSMRQGPIMFCLTLSSANNHEVAWKLSEDGKLSPTQIKTK